MCSLIKKKKKETWTKIQPSPVFFWGDVNVPVLACLSCIGLKNSAQISSPASRFCQKCKYYGLLIIKRIKKHIKALSPYVHSAKMLMKLANQRRRRRRRERETVETHPPQKVKVSCMLQSATVTTEMFF